MQMYVYSVIMYMMFEIMIYTFICIVYAVLYEALTMKCFLDVSL